VVMQFRQKAWMHGRRTGEERVCRQRGQVRDLPRLVSSEWIVRRSDEREGVDSVGGAALLLSFAREDDIFSICVFFCIGFIHSLCVYLVESAVMEGKEGGGIFG